MLQQEAIILDIQLKAVFDLVGKASHPIILQNLIRYLDRNHLPAFYEHPELLSQEFKQTLNTLLEDYRCLGDHPCTLHPNQIFVSLDINQEAAGDSGEVSLKGRLRIYVDKLLQPALEESISIQLNDRLSLETCRRDLYLHGEKISTRIYPAEKSENWLKRWRHVPKSQSYHIPSAEANHH